MVIKAYDKQEWETIAASLAVITAVFATWSSLRIIWRQEDDLEPDIVLYFDLDSRSRVIQLLIKNVGGQNAYDVSVKWSTALYNYENEEVNFPTIPILLKSETYRLFVGASVETFEKAKNDGSELTFSGPIEYRITKRKRKHITKNFDLSLEAYRKKLRPISNEQNFYIENVSISKQLNHINETLKKLVNTKNVD